MVCCTRVWGEGETGGHKGCRDLATHVLAIIDRFPACSTFGDLIPVGSNYKRRRTIHSVDKFHDWWRVKQIREKEQATGRTLIAQR